MMKQWKMAIGLASGNMIEAKIEGVDFVVANTDAQQLKKRSPRSTCFFPVSIAAYFPTVTFTALLMVAGAS